ncbi:MAG TPA: undecaprenyl-phosphate galactose phosphotransferase WbaP [Planctomycetota bacterium]|nr:undecaprenyl-phosphate galactose phosphotransferase WbaP [Planctomycetota bacterium]
MSPVARLRAQFQLSFPATLSKLEVVSLERESAHFLEVRTRPLLTLFSIVMADCFSLVLACSAAVLLRHTFVGGVEFDFYLGCLPFLSIVIAALAVARLYSVVALNPFDELRRICQTLTLCFLAMAAATYVFKDGDFFARSIFFTAWVLCLFSVPLGRAAVRSLCAHRRWWGQPVVILGAGTTGQAVVAALQRQPWLGLKPVAFLDDDPEKSRGCELRLVRDPKFYLHGSPYEPKAGVPVIGSLSLAPVVAEELRIRHAIVAIPHLERERLLKLLESSASKFNHVFVIPDLSGLSSLWVTARDLGGVLSLELRHQLLLTWPRLLKRAFDLTLTVLGGLLILPVIAVIALLIRLDSSGGAFYSQVRLGRDGRRFRAFKFRTMYGDGELRLQELLEKDPELRREYEQYHKLRNDPRVTRIGRLLRKYSLDELPQLWNVLRGEMSLVGPRPYLPREVPEMDGCESRILRVRPGMTGLWQVTERNDFNFSQRIKTDEYYVRNWSLWIDVYVLARTAGVVLSGTGT